MWLFQVLQAILYHIQMVCPHEEGLSSAMMVYLAGARGCFPPPLTHEDLLLECERAQQSSQTT